MDELRVLEGQPDVPSGATAGPAADGASTEGPPVDDLPFDRSLDELRRVVTRLEDGGLPLEESIALYERGVALHDHCARLLAAAELRVQRLVDASGGSPRALDLRPDDETDE
jgi:exodeoxyribonuclease VII small subunit